METLIQASVGFAVAVFAYLIGLWFERKRSFALLNQQKRNIYNGLITYSLGEGANAQVCIPVKRLANMLLGANDGT